MPMLRALAAPPLGCCRSLINQKAEREITINGEPAPPAYVFITNRAFVLYLARTACVELWVAGGFKIDDFPLERAAGNILEMHKARERHIEVYWLLKTLDAHREIPSTFDDRLPEEILGEQTEVPIRVG